MRDSMVFYRSWFDAARNLNPKDFKAAILAVADYGMADKEPELSGFAESFFTMAKPFIDVNTKRYENGKKGGRPRKNDGANDGESTPKKTEYKPKENQAETKSKPNKTKRKPSGNQVETEPKPNVSVSVSVSESVSVKDKNKEHISNESGSLFSAQAREIPTLDEVRTYVSTTGSEVDPEYFYDYYRARGWMMGGSQMTDWKAAVDSWGKNNLSDHGRMRRIEKFLESRNQAMN